VVVLREINAGGFTQEFKRMNVFERRSIQVKLSVFNPQHGIEENVALGVGIGNASEVAAKRQVAPAAWFDVL
jgi:hypothetical protein